MTVADRNTIASLSENDRTFVEWFAHCLSLPDHVRQRAELRRLAMGGYEDAAAALAARPDPEADALIDAFGPIPQGKNKTQP